MASSPERKDDFAERALREAAETCDREDELILRSRARTLEEQIEHLQERLEELNEQRMRCLLMIMNGGHR